jgi:hypothetical protein
MNRQENTLRKKETRKEGKKERNEKEDWKVE